MFLELLLVQAPRAHLVTTGLASPTASSDTSPNRNCGVKKSKHTENNSTIKETDLFKVITCFTLVLSLSKARLIPSRRAGLKATLQVLTDPSPNRGHPRRSWEKREDDGKLLTVLVMPTRRAGTAALRLLDTAGCRVTAKRSCRAPHLGCSAPKFLRLVTQRQVWDFQEVADCNPPLPALKENLHKRR
nr:uncharacterized protein LOC110365830 isoform X2 [Columba livia]